MIFDVTEATFEELVIRKSKDLPVVADFWADWCAPCRALAPILERLAEKHAGRLALARINVDANPLLAARYEVRGIPTVKVFSGGKVVTEFVGLRSPEEIDGIVQPHFARQSPGEIEPADRYLAGGRWEQAQALYRKLLEQEPANSRAHLGLGTIAFHQARWNDADKHLNLVEAGTPGSEVLPAMLARLYFEKQPVPELDAATEKLRQDPSSADSLTTLGLAYARSGEYERALETLSQALEASAEARQGEAKKAFIKILDILGRDSETGRKFGRRLSMILFS